jgi:hypothetical protein
LRADEVNETRRPSAEMPVATLPYSRSVCSPAEVTDTRAAPSVDSMSFTKTSVARLVSPATRSVELELNATTRPSADSRGLELPAGAPAPALPARPSAFTDARRLRLVAGSWTTTWWALLVWPGVSTRLVAVVTKATWRPSPDRRGPVALALAGWPSAVTDTTVAAGGSGAAPAHGAAAATAPDTTRAMTASAVSRGRRMPLLHHRASQDAVRKTP